MKLQKIVIFLLSGYLIASANTEINQLAQGLGLVVADYEEVLKQASKVYSKYPNIAAAITDPSTSSDVRSSLLDPLIIKLLLASEPTAKKIGTDVNKVKDLIKDPFEFMGPQEYIISYFSDNSEFKKFQSTLLGKGFLSNFKSVMSGTLNTPDLVERKNLFTIIKDHIDWLIGKNAQQSFIKKLNQDIKDNLDDIKKLINKLEQKDYFENVEEKLYKKLEDLSGIKANDLKKAFQQKINSSQTLENVILENEKRWEDIKATNLVQNKPPLKNDYRDIFSALIDNDKGDFNRKAFARELSIYAHPHDFKGLINHVLSRKDKLFGDPEKVLFDQLDDNNSQEKALKDILKDKSNKDLHDLLIDPNNISIIDVIKKSTALTYLTNPDKTAQQHAIKKLIDLIQSMGAQAASNQLKNDPEALATPQYQLYYLFNDADQLQKNLRDVLSGTNDPLGKALRGLNYANMKEIVDTIKNHKDKATLLPYITNNNGTYTRADLARIINNLNTAIKLNNANDQKTERHNLSEHLNNMTPITKMSYDKSKDFVDNTLLNSNDRLTIEELNALETTLQNNDNLKQLTTIWKDTLKDNKFDAFKNNIAKEPLALEKLAQLCQKDCQNKFEVSDSNTLINALNDIKQANSEEDIINAIDW